MLLAEFGVGQVLWSLFWIFLWVMWFWLVISIFADIIRDDELSGVSKAIWSIFVIIVPYLGVFVYLIARGSGMGRREMERAQAAEDQFKAYVRQTAGSSGTADELARLAELHSAGTLSDAEYEAAKAKVLG